MLVGLGMQTTNLTVSGGVFLALLGADDAPVEVRRQTDEWVNSARSTAQEGLLAGGRPAEMGAVSFECRSGTRHQWDEIWLRETRPGWRPLWRRCHAQIIAIVVAQIADRSVDTSPGQTNG